MRKSLLSINSVSFQHCKAYLTNDPGNVRYRAKLELNSFLAVRLIFRKKILRINIYNMILFDSLKIIVK
jgi:hypothetical protein